MTRAARLLSGARVLLDQAVSARGAQRRAHFIDAARLLAEHQQVAPSEWWQVRDNLIQVTFLGRAIRSLSGWCWHCLALDPAPPKHTPRRPLTLRELEKEWGGKWGALPAPSPRGWRRTRWHRQLADAEALLDEAAHLTGRERREYIVHAARLVGAASVVVPSEMYGIWKFEFSRVEDLVRRASGKTVEETIACANEGGDGADPTDLQGDT